VKIKNWSQQTRKCTTSPVWCMDRCMVCSRTTIIFNL